MPCNDIRPVLRLVLFGFAAAANGQTIGDYSRAQGALLERNMMQAIGRPISTTSSPLVESPAASDAPVATARDPREVKAAGFLTREELGGIIVNGVFATRD